nr:NADH dehydrogenase subunit 4L [Anatoecus icterodes]UTT72542.1 NADH dehydrogenase subunit 4L [Anatoecus icterodes]
MIFCTLLAMSIMKLTITNNLMMMILSLEICISILFMMFMFYMETVNHSYLLLSFLLMMICEGCMGLSILVSISSILNYGTPTDLYIK